MPEGVVAVHPRIDLLFECGVAALAASWIGDSQTLGYEEPLIIQALDVARQLIAIGDGFACAPMRRRLATTGSSHSTTWLVTAK